MERAHGETLTFLLSDIEGSTRRWDRDEPAMARALARHDELLRDALAAHGCRWIKHTGDGAIAAFPSALGAVGAAVAAQRALAREDWGAVGGLRARMAVHTGEARHRDGDFFGPALNRVARVLDLAHGGQVLLTLPTEELVRDRLDQGLGLLDLGLHRLEDLDHEERLYQVVGDGLPQEFPALRTTSGTVTLPEFRTSFVGREDDIDELGAVLEQHRLITLTGVGGSGKTRLAVELARSVHRRFPDGVHFVDLAAIVDEELVARQTAKAVGAVTGGLVGPSNEPIRDQLLRTVQGKRLLLLLDNCEHLLDACADHVEDLLAASPDLRVIATSREPLALDGERSWPVRSLALPSGTEDDAASLRLLVDRIREVRPDHELRDDEREHLAEICRRLDGLPLALELAAARLAHLSAADVASRLDDRFRLLSGGRRRAERQQTLRATIDWSYDLLDENERVLLRRLSVFVGGAPLDAVEEVAMAGLEDDLAIDLLGRLVDRSLVVADTSEGPTRYRLLETIRLYGEEKLVAADESTEIRDRHRDWYLGWLEATPWDLRLVSPVVADRIQPEYDNLRLALEWSAARGQHPLVARFVCALAGFAVLNGYADELDRWANLARSGDLSPVMLAELDTHVAYVDTWRYNGDPTTFVGLRQRTEAAFDVLPTDHPCRALARCLFGATHTVTHPHEPWRIAEAASEAVALAVELEAPWMRVVAMGFLARARLYALDASAARDIILEAMASDGWADEHDGHNLRHELAVSLHLLGEHEEALENALRVARQGPITWRHIGLLDASIITAALGDPAGGRELIRELLDHLDQLRWRHPLAVSDCATALGAIATYEHRWEDAAQLLATTGGNSSHPAVFAVWLHYRDRTREALPREVRHRCIEEGASIGVRRAIARELRRDSEVIPIRLPEGDDAGTPAGR